MAEVFAELAGENIWLLEICLQMNRYTGDDTEIRENFLFDFKIRKATPTPYIIKQVLEFQTPLTPNAPMTLDKFVAQMKRLSDLLTEFKTLNPIYINDLRVVQEMPDGKFNVGIFGKNKKFKTGQVKSVLPEAFVGGTLMPVDLIEIRGNVNQVLEKRRGRTKTYDKGAFQVEGMSLYSDPIIARQFLPSLRNKKVIIIRVNEARQVSVNEISVYQCGRLSF
jgi:hypothetical protein